MSIINQKDFLAQSTEDYTDIYIGVRWNKYEGKIEPTHHDKDMTRIRMIHDDSNNGHVIISHADATAGDPSFTEVLRIRHDGLFLLRGDNVLAPVVVSATEPTNPFLNMIWIDTSGIAGP